MRLCILRGGEPGVAHEAEYRPPPQVQPTTPATHGPAMREFRRIPSGIKSSSERGRSPSDGARGRDRGQRSSPTAPQFAADLEGGSPLASRRGFDAGGPAGAADGDAGAAEGGAGGTD